MKIENILLAGIATTVTAWGLQKAYQATNFYPPQPVFWFAIGATAAVGLGLVKAPEGFDRVTLKELRTLKVGPFAAFDLVTAFAGVTLLAPRLGVSRERALWATVPAGLLVHQALGIETPLNRMVFGPGSFAAKAAVAGMTYKALL